MDREKVIEAFADYEPYSHDLPCVTIKSEIYRNTFALLKEQEAEIRQLRLALDIAKGTCNGIIMNPETKDRR